MVALNDLVTIDMIADRLNIPAARIKNQIVGKDGRRRGPHFPPPLVGSGTRGVWSWERVREWSEQSKVTEIDDLRRAAKRSKGARRQKLPRTA